LCIVQDLVLNDLNDWFPKYGLVTCTILFKKKLTILSIILTMIHFGKQSFPYHPLSGNAAYIVLRRGGSVHSC
jgi:hypothetical protein